MEQQQGEDNNHYHKPAFGRHLSVVNQLAVEPDVCPRPSSSSNVFGGTNNNSSSSSSSTTTTTTTTSSSSSSSEIECVEAVERYLHLYEDDPHRATKIGGLPDHICLLLGSRADADDCALVNAKTGIRHIVNCAQEASPPALPRHTREPVHISRPRQRSPNDPAYDTRTGLTVVSSSEQAALHYFCCELLDEEGERLDVLLKDACEWLDAVLRQSPMPPVLLHSQHGVSRSAVVLVAYLMHRYNWSLSCAMRHVRRYRPHVAPNDGFMQSLEKWEKCVFAAHAHANAAAPKTAQSSPTGPVCLEPLSLDTSVCSYAYSPSGLSPTPTSYRCNWSNDDATISRFSIAKSDVEENSKPSDEHSCHLTVYRQLLELGFSLPDDAAHFTRDSL